MYKGPDSPIITAVAIQKTQRYFKANKNFRQPKFQMARTKIIQRCYRLWQLKNLLQKKLKIQKADLIKLWGDMQSEFNNSWSFISQNKRIEFHKNSFLISET